MKHISIMKQIHIVLIITISSAWAVSKNTPDERAVEDMLRDAGEKHWVDGMDVDELGSSRVVDHLTGEDTFFHIFTSYIDETHMYRVIIVDNDQRYLGYYLSPYEPVDYEGGAVLLDAQDGSSYFPLPISTEGFPSRIRTGMSITTFVENEAAKENSMQAGAGSPGKDSENQTQNGPMKPEYRDWTVIIDEKEVTFNAVFVRLEDNDIVLRESKQGLVNSFPGHVFSKEDQEYLKTLLDI